MNRFPAFPLTLLAILLALPVVASSADEVTHWLQRVNHALTQLNYDGTFIHSSGDDIESMRIIHSYDSKQGERERLIATSGFTRELISDSNQMICFLPDDPELVVEMAAPMKPLPLRIMSVNTRLNQFYKVEEAGYDRIAGIRARKLVINPRDEYRYGYILWLAEENDFPLRAVLFSESDMELGYMKFTHLEWPDRIDESMFQPQTQGSDFTGHRLDRQSTTAERSTHISWEGLPAGFTPMKTRRFANTTHAGEVEQIILGDGLATVSVFIEAIDDNLQILSPVERLGTAHARVSLRDGKRITVIGEVPGVTVDRVLDVVTDNGND